SATEVCRESQRRDAQGRRLGQSRHACHRTREINARALLLQGDLTNWDESDLRELTGSLMAALDENRAHDVSVFYGKLNHPSLSSQLRPYILDTSKNEVSRRIAILIAEQCELRALQPELLTLATDKT